MIAYIHGFNSSGASNTFRLLRAAFADAAALEYPCGGLFADNLTSLHSQARALEATHGPLVIVGSSLGGFYASQLSARMGRNCAMINPAVRPDVSLRKFVGRNVHFHTGEAWDFTEGMCASYAGFADVRAIPLQRLLVLGRNDDLLDPAEARAYWQGHARVHETEDGHSLTALDATTIDALRAL